MQKGKNWDRQKDFHEWASAEGYYLNNAEDLNIAIERYEEHHDVQKDEVEHFWNMPKVDWDWIHDNG